MVATAIAIALPIAWLTVRTDLPARRVWATLLTLPVFRTITVPLGRGGLLAGAALLFLHAIKELPATLILAPIGFETLATEIWNQTSFGFYEASAVPSLVLLLIAAPPLYLLSERGAAKS